MKYLGIFTLCALLIFCTTLKAEGWDNVSARSSALGGAGAAFDRGVFGSHFNPASSSRPWETLANMEFSFASSGRYRTHGSSHEQLMRILSSHDRIKNRFGQISFDATNPLDSAKYLVESLRLLENWEDVDIKRGDGFTGSYRVDFGVVFRDLFTPNDSLTLLVSHKQDYETWLEMDKTNFNFDVRLFEDYGLMIFELNKLISIYGPLSPTTIKGLAYADKLMDFGYTLPQARTIAAMLEQSGYKFPGGLSEKMLDALLLNSLIGGGKSLESGANPIKGNKTRIHYRSIMTQEIGIGYSFSIPRAEWLTIGLTAKYIRASRVDLGIASREVGFRSVLGTPRTPRHNFSLDIGLTANLYKEAGLFVGLSARNINAPRFTWNDYTYSMDPQIRLSAGIHPFTTQVPFSIGFDIDLNRVEHSLLERYYTQHFGIGLELAPQWEHSGFALRLGYSRNIGDTGEESSLSIGLGMTIWGFTLDVSGASSMESLLGSQFLFGMNMPSDLELAMQLSYGLKF